MLLSAWLSDMPGVELVGSAQTATELDELLPQARPDVLLLDVMLPEGPTTRERVDRIRDAVPGVRIVLMSSLRPADLEVEADTVGADFAWSKAEGPDALEAAVHARNASQR